MAARANQPINVIRSLAKVSYGAQPESMLPVYRGYTRALLEWAATLFSNENKSCLRSLDIMQNSALRSVLGCT